MRTEAATGSRTVWLRWKRFWRDHIEEADGIRRIKRLVRQAIGTELRYFPQVRVRTEQSGGWYYSPGALEPSPLVYSLGVGEDVDFDLRLIECSGATVHAFDPTPGAVQWAGTREFPERFHFHPLGISDFDGIAEFQPPTAEGNVCFTLLERSSGGGPSVSAPVRRLRTVMEQLGHDVVDLLKMDIEGAEYVVIPDILEAGVKVRQLLVEFHHRFSNVGNHRTAEAVDLLLAHGYRIAHISPSGREYAFLSADAIEGLRG